jgi:hypothetical protein
MAPVVGSGGVCICGSLDSGCPFYVVAFDRNLVLVAVKMSSHYFHIIKKFL